MTTRGAATDEGSEVTGVAGFQVGMWNIRLVAEAMVAGQRIEVSMYLAEPAYRDEAARRIAEESLRRKLMTAILERWKPEVRAIY